MTWDTNRRKTLMTKHATDADWEEKGELSDTLVKRLSAATITAKEGNRIRWDGKLKGFGLRVTAAGSKSFVFRYRNAAGRDRIITIGPAPAWTVEQAIKGTTVQGSDGKKGKAWGYNELQRLVDAERDPLAEREQRRLAPTISDLCDTYIRDYLTKLRPTSQYDYRNIVEKHIRPKLGKLKVADLHHLEVEKLHSGIAAKYRANRVIAVLVRMLSIAVKLGYRADNPARGIELHREHKRTRFLKLDEIARLMEVLKSHRETDDGAGAANLIMLLLMTGARLGETRHATWDQFDLRDDAGSWHKPHETTKTDDDHIVPLSKSAVAILREMKAVATTDYVFPSPHSDSEQRSYHETQKHWLAISKKAGLKNVRMHDLRHTYASVLVSDGMSLPIIGKLLGHKQTATTARYAHLFADPLRIATERADDIITGGRPLSNVVALPRRQRAV